MEQQYETKYIFKYWSNIKNDVIDFIYVIISCTVLAIVVTIIGPIRSFLVKNHAISRNVHDQSLPRYS